MLKFNLRYFTSVLFLFILLICLTAQAEIEFFKEDLQFELRDGYFIVAGNYYFRNPTDQAILVTLFYPIPRDSMLGMYDSAEVIYSSQQTDSPITVIKENGFFFNVEIDANSTAQYYISYRQKLLGNKAKYIFTTTSTWGKPLESAVFQLTFPKNLTIDSLSMLPDSLQENDNEYTLFWEKENFMPREDFVIRYHEENAHDIPPTETDIEKRHEFMYLRLTPFLIPGVAVGYTHRIRLKDEGVIDCAIAANYHSWADAHQSYGLSLITEHFGNTKAKGFFFRANVGAEYGEMQNPFDDDIEPENKWFPNVTVGLGYSIIIFNSSYLRLSAEIGYTMLLGRINCEFLF